MDRIEAGINALSSQEFKTFEEWALRNWIEAAAFWTYAGGGNTWEVKFRGKSIIPSGTLITKYKKPYLSHSVFCDSALEALRVQKK